MLNKLTNKELAAAPQYPDKVIVDKKELEDLKTWVRAFGITHAVTYASQHGLPKDTIYQSHYDILQKCGARMDDFTPYKEATNADN